MILFFKRLVTIIRLIFNNGKEPFFNMGYLFRYLMNGYFFPSYKKFNYTPQIKVEASGKEKFVMYNSIKIYYPQQYNEEVIRGNFNNLLNEQTAIGNNINPHKYLSSDEIKKDWIIYDIGAAEGSQSKLWLESEVKKIVIIEPMPSFFVQLRKTFKEEVESGRVVLINYGISNKKQTFKIENENITFDTLENLIREFNLPLPTYIKADIEGEELNFLESSVQLLKGAQLETIQITTYHRPSDYIDIPKFLSQFSGEGFLSDGVMIFNRDGMVNGSYRKKLYHPVIRKCLYTFNFIH